MTERTAIEQANRKAERHPGREYLVVKRTAHPAIEGGLTFMPVAADQVHTPAPDATVVHRVVYRGQDGDGLATYSLSPGISA